MFFQKSSESARSRRFVRSRQRMFAAAAVFATCVSAMFAPRAQADTDAWSNPAGGIWSNGANWSQGVAPTSYTAQFNLASVGGYTVTGSGSTQGFSLLNDKVTLDLNGGGLSI